MEKILETILTEVKGVKEEVREIRAEVKDTKQELRQEMQVMKEELKTEILEEVDKKMEKQSKEILEEVDNKIGKQSKEIGQELNEIVIFLEKRDNKIQATLDQTIEIQKEILKELEINREEHKIFNAKIHRLELGQQYMEEKLLKIS